MLPSTHPAGSRAGNSEAKHSKHGSEARTPPRVEPSKSPFVHQEVHLPIHLNVARQSSWLCDRANKQFTTGTELTMLNTPHAVHLQLYKRPMHLSTYCMLSYVGFLALPEKAGYNCYNRNGSNPECTLWTDKQLIESWQLLDSGARDLELPLAAADGGSMLANNWHPEVVEEVLIRKPGWGVLVSASAYPPVLLNPAKKHSICIEKEVRQRLVDLGCAFECHRRSIICTGVLGRNLIVQYSTVYSKVYYIDQYNTSYSTVRRSRSLSPKPKTSPVPSAPQPRKTFAAVASSSEDQGLSQGRAGSLTVAKHDQPAPATVMRY